MTIIYFDIDGQPVPADECTWVVTAPCGCECSWHMARYCLTEDEAWDGFSSSKAARRRDEKLGYRMKIIRHKDIRIQEDCPHTPRWGVEPRPTPDGHTWATKHGSRSVHLLPIVIEKDAILDAFVGKGAEIAALCKRASAWSWSTRWGSFEGRTDCAACTATAKKVLAEAVPE